jgi:hypothetical protein
MLLFFGHRAEGFGLERLGNNGVEDWWLECEDESKPSGTVALFRRITSGVTKSVGKK